MTQLNEAGLLPCPFCGGAPTIRDLGAMAAFGYRIHCLNHDCFGPSTPVYGNLNDATFAWNRRAYLSSTAPDEEVGALVERLRNPGSLHSGWRDSMREAADHLEALNTNTASLLEIIETWKARATSAERSLEGMRQV